MELLKRIETKQARLGVIGLGYVGLPLAIEFARAGFHVVGYDVDKAKVADLNAGSSYIPDVPSAHVAEAVKAGTFRATTDGNELNDVDIIDICVPTPLRKTRDPDLSYVVKAVETTASVLRKGQLVILESTTYPGTTDEVVQPALEAKGLKAGEDFYLAFSPERVDPGNPTHQDEEHPEGRRRHQRGQHRGGCGVLQPGDRHRRPGQLDARRRDGEAAREHVPRGEHRPRERARADEPPDGHQRVGGHRRGEDQAVRLHAVLSGPRPGRPLHSDRSVLFVVEGAAERLRGALHRARRQRQRRHAGVRRRTDRAGAEHA